MKRWLAYAALFVAILGRCASANAQTLWHETTLGMSVDQVRSAVPAAQAVDPSPSTTITSGLNAGAEKRLHVPEFDLAGAPFTGSFYFKDGALVAVTLRSMDASRSAFNSIVESLRSKYGRELSDDVRGGRLGTSGTMKWAAGRTTIALSLFDLSAGTTILIQYSAALAVLSDKL